MIGVIIEPYKHVLHVHVLKTGSDLVEYPHGRQLSI